MRAVVNFSNGRYIKGQSRLIKSMAQFGYHTIAFTEYHQIGSPTHQDNPYAFKLHAIDKAREMGFTSILYLDASIWAIKDPSPLFEIIEKDGYLMQEAGHLVSRWSNDACLNYFGITREEASKMLMWSAGFCGLDFKSEIAREFFARWKNARDAGAFRGSWTDHRHDMTCASIIANQMGLKYQSGNELMAYAGPDDPVNDTIILKAQGV